MLAPRSLLSLIAAAVVLAVACGPAWGWTATAQRTLAGVTNADRVVVDGDGTIYLLDQFGARDGSRPYTTHYTVRVVKVASDLSSTDTSLPTTESDGFGPYGNPVDALYSSASLSPSGFAIDRDLRRIYVATGDGVAQLSLGASPSWRTFASGGWYSRGLVAGAIAVDPSSHHVYVADYGAVFQCFLAPFDCGEPLVTGALRITEYDADGNLVGRLPLPDECSAGSDLSVCPVGAFEQSFSANYSGYGPTGMQVVGSGPDRRIAALHVSRNTQVERALIALIDPATGRRVDEIGTGIGTRPMGVVDGVKSPNAQSLDFATLGDGSYVLPEIGAGPGADGLFEMRSDGTVTSRFMARGGATCGLGGPNVRLTSALVGGQERLVALEDASPVRLTVLDRDGAGCPVRPVVTPRLPEWTEIPVSVSARATGGDDDEFPARDGDTVALPIPRASDGTVLTNEQDYSFAFPAPIVDADNGGDNKGPWGSCTFDAPGVDPVVGFLDVDAASGCSVTGAGRFPQIDLPPLSFVRPLPLSLSVTDDDGQTVNWSVRVVSTDPLTAAFRVEADADQEGRFRFDLDQACDREACTAPGDYTQLSIGPIDRWDLDYGDGNAISGDWRDIGQAIEHEYTKNGTFTARLTLHAAGKPDATATRDISVDREDTTIPLPGLDVSPTTAVLGTAMTFVPSDAGSGTISSWTIDFDDGQTASGTAADFAPVTHTYRSAGSYAPRLTIELTNGRSAGVTRTVSLTERPAQTVAEQTVVKSCLTPFGVPLSVLGLGDQTLCGATACDLDLAQLGLLQMGFERPASCDAEGTATDIGGAGAVAKVLGARPRLGGTTAIRRLTLARDGRVSIRVRCTAGAGSCGGEAVLDLRPAGGGTIRLGKAKFTNLAVGAARTLRIRPSAARRRDLAKEDQRRRRVGELAKVRVRLLPAATAGEILRPRSESLVAGIRISRAPKTRRGHRTAASAGGGA